MAFYAVLLFQAPATDSTEQSYIMKEWLTKEGVSISQDDALFSYLMTGQEQQLKSPVQGILKAHLLNPEESLQLSEPYAVMSVSEEDLRRLLEQKLARVLTPREAEDYALADAAEIRLPS